ncbi:hypothetical protein IFM89_007207 [Coptis chinensis]|uniref:thymidylate synthase n=1 Tax=Coptis chinensis TaxID=261450 RepID=A0A835GXN1_9MAGN|nr:hypothetical protein IFM89_007207 [Coptis chinensis]
MFGDYGITTVHITSYPLLCGVDVTLSKVVQFATQVPKLEESEIVVQLVDPFSNPVLFQQEKLILHFSSSSGFLLWLFDVENGLYIGRYTANEVGVYELYVAFDGNQLLPCPFWVHVYGSEYFLKASNDTITVWEDESVSFDVIGNDHYANSSARNAPQFVSLPVQLQATEDVLSPKFGNGNFSGKDEMKELPSDVGLLVGPILRKCCTLNQNRTLDIEVLTLKILCDSEDGDLSPIYGFQWRHFGARYTNMHADYTGQGFDQLLNVIERVKNKPDDRRIILSAWNPADLKLMALPPCHMFAQTFGSFMWPTKSYHVKCIRDLQTWVLVCLSTYVASYAILTCMIARVCGLVVLVENKLTKRREERYRG